MSWFRLDADYAQDGTLRRCRAVAWWPLILCAMKRGNGVASDDDIAADVLADIGQGSEDAARVAVEKLKTAGMLIPAAGGWTTPRWGEFQPDPTASDRAKRYRDRNKAAAEAAASRCVTVTERDVTARHGDVTVRNAPSRLTGHDMTGQDGDVVADTSREAEPEPDQIIASATDAIGEKLAGHPGKEALTPFAEVAVSVLGVCPEVYTLESWLMARYSVDRVEYGLRQAKQAALGQFMPLGKIIISAGRWMQRAQPEEYRKRPQAAHGGAETVQPIPAQSAAKPPITAAEADAMLAEVLR